MVEVRSNIILSILILIAISFFTSCSKDNSNDLDADIYIINTYRSNTLGGSAEVRYQVENISDRDINGWNIYFRVSMESGQQVVASHGLTYYLEPEEISKKLIAIGKLPIYFTSDDAPAKATLKLVDIY